MKQGSKIKVRLVRSGIARDKWVRANLQALGLRKLGDEQVYTESPALLGMIRKVQSLVEVNPAN